MKKSIQMMVLALSAALLVSCGGNEPAKENNTEDKTTTTPESQTPVPSTMPLSALPADCPQLIADYSAVADEYDKLADEFVATGKVNDARQKELDEKARKLSSDWATTDQSKIGPGCLSHYSQISLKISGAVQKMATAAMKNMPAIK